jgi:hypothetical protein
MKSYGDGGASVVIGGTTYTLATGSSETWTDVCVTSCETVTLITDYYGAECGWIITDANGAEVVNSEGDCVEDPVWGDVTCYVPDVTSANLGCIEGCMDATACNYDATATCDDGSCYTLMVSIDQNGKELMANITNATGATTTNWYNVQEESTWLMESDATSFTPRYDCSYFIITEDENCSVQSDTYVYVQTANRIGAITTSPNPTRGLINVKFENAKNQIVKLDLINSSGTKLDQFLTSDNELNIDISKYPSGNYYINFDSSDNGQGCVEEKRQVITNKIILNK